MKTSIASLLILLSLNTSSPAQTRKWTDKSGEFTTLAELVEVRDRQVVLRQRGNRRIVVDISRLSKADQELVATMKPKLEEQRLLKKGNYQPNRHLTAVLKQCGGRWGRFVVTASPEKNPGLNLDAIHSWVPWATEIQKYLDGKSKKPFAETLQESVHIARQKQLEFHQSTGKKMLYWDLLVYPSQKVTRDQLHNAVPKDTFKISTKGYLRLNSNANPIAAEKGQGTWPTPIQWHTLKGFSFGVMENEVAIIRVGLDPPPTESTTANKKGKKAKQAKQAKEKKER